MAQTKSEVQQRVLNRIGVGLVFSVLAIYLAWNYAPIKVPTDPDMAARLFFTIRWLTPSLIPVALGILIVANLRFENANTAGATPTSAFAQDLVRLPQQALQNTLENTLVHIPLMLILSTYLDSETLKLIPILVCLFVFARISFYIGYLATSDPIGRAFGFSISFLGNVVALGYLLYRLAMGGANYGLA